MMLWPGEPRARVSALLIAAVTVIVVALASACGGDDNSGATSPAASQPAQESATPTGGQTPAPTAAPDAAPLQTLAARYLAGVDGKVVYGITSTNFGWHPNGTWTVYHLGKSTRQDWETDAAGFPAATITIRTENNDFVCTTTPYTKSCNKSSEEEAQGMFSLFVLVEEIPAAIAPGLKDATVTNLPDETVAGVTAKCYNAEVSGRIGVGPKGTETIKICFADSGAMLLMHRTVNFTDKALPTATLMVDAQTSSPAAEADFQPIVAPLN